MTNWEMSRNAKMMLVGMRPNIPYGVFALSCLTDSSMPAVIIKQLIDRELIEKVAINDTRRWKLTAKGNQTAVRLRKQPEWATKRSA